MGIDKAHADTLIKSYTPGMLSVWPTCPYCGQETGYMERCNIIEEALFNRFIMRYSCTHVDCGQLYTLEWQYNNEGDRVLVTEGHEP